MERTARKSRIFNQQAENNQKVYVPHQVMFSAVPKDKTTDVFASDGNVYATEKSTTMEDLGQILSNIFGRIFADCRGVTLDYDITSAGMGFNRWVAKAYFVAGFKNPASEKIAHDKDYRGVKPVNALKLKNGSEGNDAFVERFSRLISQQNQGRVYELTDFAKDILAPFLDSIALCGRFINSQERESIFFNRQTNTPVKPNIDWRRIASEARMTCNNIGNQVMETISFVIPLDPAEVLRCLYNNPIKHEVKTKDASGNEKVSTIYTYSHKYSFDIRLTQLNNGMNQMQAINIRKQDNEVMQKLWAKYNGSNALSMIIMPQA